MRRAAGSLRSPDGSLEFSLEFSGQGAPRYSVLRTGVEVVAWSELGIEMDDQSFVRNLTLSSMSESVAHRDTYTRVAGKRLVHDVVFNERTWKMVNDGGHTMDLVVRAYDDGVAFRYGFPAPTSGIRTIAAELTTFNVSSGLGWMQPQDPPGRTTPAYEGNIRNAIDLATATADAGWTMPALMRSNGHWIVIAEAGLGKDYCGCRLGNQTENGFPIMFPQPGEGAGIGEVEPTHTGPMMTSWRVVITDDDLANVFSSDLVSHVSPACRIDDIGWIRPGRVAWGWWSDRGSPTSPSGLRRFVHFASEMGWEHHLIDANWNTVELAAIRGVIDEATALGLGTFLWYNSGGPHNTVAEQPRDRMHHRQSRRLEFAEIASWGVVGVKIDFFHSDKQERISDYLDILEDAAAAKLMVNFHGCTVPRGWEREWPNLMTMEGVRGAEQYATDGYPREAPALLTILPFTRNLVGSMDYTPVTFSNIEHPHLTTGGFELALSVVVESGLQHFADSPDAYRQLPPYALDVLKDVPVTWDESRLLAGHPGSYCVIARRSGMTWWIGAINGRPEPIDVEIDLSELAGGGSVALISDGPEQRRDGTDLVRSIHESDVPLRFQLGAYGGLVGRTDGNSRARPHR